jgi:hypothetical protein
MRLMTHKWTGFGLKQKKLLDILSECVIMQTYTQRKATLTWQRQQ